MGFLAAKHINVLQWPPMSPDLNLIENLWSSLKLRVDAQRPQSAVHLERLAGKEWAALTSDRVRVGRLFDSMEQRLNAVVAANGGFTRY